MKSYLEIKVPLDAGAEWLAGLKEVINPDSVRWQNGFYHITLAFIDETPADVDMVSVIDRCFEDAPPYTLTFDQLDVFAIPSGLNFICLRPERLPSDFLLRVEKVRNEIARVGGQMFSEFMPHVTIGRVDGKCYELTELKGLLSNYKLLPLKMDLKEISYRVFRGPILYEKSFH